MDQKIFDILQAISLDNYTQWGVFETEEPNETNVKLLFGTEEELTLKGKFLFMYVDESTPLRWINTETSDYELTILKFYEDIHQYPLKLMIWQIN